MQGISATVVTIEVNCTKGIQFFLVGLPDVAVRESHERIISALQVSGYKFPRKPHCDQYGACGYPEGRFVVRLAACNRYLAAAEELDASR